MSVKRQFFKEGSNTKVVIDPQEHLVVIEVNDDKMLQRYKLTFLKCDLISLDYSRPEREEDLDLLSNLSIDGVEELDHPSSRFFKVHFYDESTLLIECAEFSEERISGYSAYG